MFDDESKGGLAKWRESDETWVLPEIDLAGNNIKPILTASKDSHRPDSDYAKYKRQRDSNPRWRHNNVISLKLDTLGKASKSHDDPSSKSDVTHILNMDINDDDEHIDVHNYDVPGNPYMRFSEVSSWLFSFVNINSVELLFTFVPFNILHNTYFLE